MSDTSTMIRLVLLASLICVDAVPSQKSLIQPTIVGGQNARIEDFKYVASLKKYDMHHCGSTVLNDKWLLTAAHCLHGHENDNYSIRTGTSDMFADGTDYNVEKIVVHENYDPVTYENDVALVQVKENIKFDEKTFPLPLPSINFELVEGELSTVTGWGYLEEGGPLSMDLQMVRVPIVGPEKCTRMYDSFKNITESMICAGRDLGQKDACQGDSGGGLTVRGTLVGVVSWGKGCARPNAPGVYANVQYFRDWILQHTQVQPIQKTISMIEFNATMLITSLLPKN